MFGTIHASCCRPSRIFYFLKWLHLCMNASMISCMVDTSYARWECAHLMWSWGVGFHSFRAMFHFSLRKARWGATHSSSVFFLAMSDLGNCIERRTPWIFLSSVHFFDFCLVLLMLRSVPPIFVIVHYLHTSRRQSSSCLRTCVFAFLLRLPFLLE